MQSKRIESLDILRGLVMVLMALDHVRDYVHLGALTYDPTNLDTTTPSIFVTRWVTHLCAPIFVFLSGLSAFLYAEKVNSKAKAAKFLLTRGLWLMFLECTLISFLWTFNPDFGFVNLQVIWAIGLSMVFLSALIYLPFKLLLTVGLVIVFSHNLLDPITVEGTEPLSIIWYMAHQSSFIVFSEGFIVSFAYPVLPWIGVMVLGYCGGQIYSQQPNTVLLAAEKRRSVLIRLALAMLIAFVAIRYLNIYGDLKSWENQATAVLTFMSFMNVSKYPPSLLFVLSTLGFGLLFLAYFETARNKVLSWLKVYGRVPFLFYILHLFLAHLAGNLVAIAQGGSWSDMVWTNALFQSGKLVEHGINLPLTYVVWVVVVIALYSPCKQYHAYRANNLDKWWLKYL